MIPLDEIASAVNAVLPASSTDAMRRSVQVAVLSTIKTMNLVSRDEVEELEKTLLQLREKIEALEESVAKLQQPEPDVVESFENEGRVIPPNPETNNKYEREVEEADVIKPADPRDLFWESVKGTGVSQETLADLLDQLAKKRKYGMTDDEIRNEIKRALLDWIRTNKAPEATPNLKSEQGPQIIIRPSNVTEISTSLMKLFIKGQVEIARQSTGPSKPKQEKKHETQLRVFASSEGGAMTD